MECRQPRSLSCLCGRITRSVPCCEARRPSLPAGAVPAPVVSAASAAGDEKRSVPSAAPAAAAPAATVSAAVGSKSSSRSPTLESKRSPVSLAAGAAGPSASPSHPLPWLDCTAECMGSAQMRYWWDQLAGRDGLYLPYTKALLEAANSATQQPFIVKMESTLQSCVPVHWRLSSSPVYGCAAHCLALDVYGCRFVADVLKSSGKVHRKLLLPNLSHRRWVLRELVHHYNVRLLTVGEDFLVYEGDLGTAPPCVPKCALLHAVCALCRAARLPLLSGSP